MGETDSYVSTRVTGRFKRSSGKHVCKWTTRTSTQSDCYPSSGDDDRVAWSSATTTTTKWSASAIPTPATPATRTNWPTSAQCTSDASTATDAASATAPAVLPAVRPDNQRGTNESAASATSTPPASSAGSTSSTSPASFVPWGQRLSGHCWSSWSTGCSRWLYPSSWIWTDSVWVSVVFPSGQQCP